MTRLGRPPRVVVVGGGIGGLRAADILTQSAELSSAPTVKPEVVVLEASNRVGGRTGSVASAVCPGAVYDIGGQWIGEQQMEAKKIAQELNISLQPQYCTGRRVLQLGDIVRTYSGLIPNVSCGLLVDIQIAIWLLQILQFLIRCCSPRGSIYRWADRTTMQAFSQGWMWTQGARALLRIVVLGLFGAEPEAISVLAFCRYVTASDSIEKMSEIGPGSLQAYTCIGGAQQISLRLAARALQNGAQIRFNSKVVAIHRSASSVLVTNSDVDTNASPYPCQLFLEGGVVIGADLVLLAMPPPIANSIAFQPPLSPHRQELMSQSRMGCIIKSVAIYDSAWWREDGFSGEVICDATDGGPAFNIFDGCTLVRDEQAVANSLRNGMPGEPAAPSAHFLGELSPPIQFVEAEVNGQRGRLVPALVAFINGSMASQWTQETPDNRRNAVLRQFVRWFRNVRALHPLEYIEQDWVANPFTKGCPIASYGEGVLQAFGLGRALAEPEWAATGVRGRQIHHIHFAGTETSDVGTGFMDGALRSGARAAAEIARDLDLLPAAMNSGVAAHPKQAQSAAASATVGERVLDEPLLTVTSHS